MGPWPASQCSVVRTPAVTTGFARNGASSSGTRIAECGHRLVYGGGRVGLMGTVADTALAAGGEVVGVITEHLVGAEVAHLGVSALEVTGSMHERKARMAELSDGVIVLPGGFGTLDESFELLTWNQLGLLAAPVVFLDVAGFFGSLFDFITHSVESGFIRPEHAALARRATTAADGRRPRDRTPARLPPQVGRPPHQLTFASEKARPAPRKSRRKRGSERSTGPTN